MTPLEQYGFRVQWEGGARLSGSHDATAAQSVEMMGTTCVKDGDKTAIIRRTVAGQNQISCGSIVSTTFSKVDVPEERSKMERFSEVV